MCVRVGLPSCSCITGQVLHWQVATMMHASHACNFLSVQSAKGDLPSDSPATTQCFMETPFLILFSASYIYLQTFLLGLNDEVETFILFFFYQQKHSCCIWKIIFPYFFCPVRFFLFYTE